MPANQTLLSDPEGLSKVFKNASDLIKNVFLARQCQKSRDGTNKAK